MVERMVGRVFRVRHYARMNEEQLDVFDQNYEEAEAAFLRAIRGQSLRSDIATSASAVAAAANAWNSEAFRLLHVSKGERWHQLDLLTERTEVLSELWTEISRAFATPPDA